MSQYQFQLAGREMCLLAETTSLYLLSRPSQKKKSANDFQASLLNSPSSCTSSCMPTETANQNVTLLHFSLSASSLFIHFPIYFLPSSCALAQVDIPSCHSWLSLSRPDSSPRPRLSVFWCVTFWILLCYYTCLILLRLLTKCDELLTLDQQMSRKNLRLQKRQGNNLDWNDFPHRSPKQADRGFTLNPTVWGGRQEGAASYSICT